MRRNDVVSRGPRDELLATLKTLRQQRLDAARDSTRYIELGKRIDEALDALGAMAREDR